MKKNYNTAAVLQRVSDSMKYAYSYTRKSIIF